MPVEVGRDEDDEPIRSCVIVAVDALASAKATKAAKGVKLPKAAQIALRALNKGIEECGASPPPSNHIPDGIKAITMDQWRDYSSRMGISASDEIRAKRIALNRASEALLAAQKISIWEPFVWTT
jgi:hypothetical protein